MEQWLQGVGMREVLNEQKPSVSFPSCWDQLPNHSTLSLATAVPILLPNPSSCFLNSEHQCLSFLGSTEEILLASLHEASLHSHWEAH